MGNLRKSELRRKRHRAKKIAKLRARYIEVKTQQEKAKILEKILRIAPGLTVEQFLKTLE